MNIPQHTSGGTGNSAIQVANQQTPNVATPSTASLTSPPVAPPLQIEDHGERYWQILQNNAEWIRFSDSKAGVILTTYGVLFTIIYTNANAVFTAVKDTKGIFWLAGIFGVTSVASVICAFWALRPRLRHNNGDSIIYFMHIAEHNDRDAYKRHAGPILDDANKYTDHLADQIFNLSKVATNKYLWTAISIYAFIGSLLTLLITVSAYVYQILSK